MWFRNYEIFEKRNAVLELVFEAMETCMQRLSVLAASHRISRRRPFDKLRERLGFCLPVLRPQSGDSPSRGE